MTECIDPNRNGDPYLKLLSKGYSYEWENAQSDIRRRGPRDIFEQRLFRYVMETKFERWKHLPVPLRVEIGGETFEGNGFREITISRIIPFDALTYLDNPSVKGYAWIGEKRDGDFVVCWIVQAQERVTVEQQGDTGFAPSVEWE